MNTKEMFDAINHDLSLADAETQLVAKFNNQLRITGGLASDVATPGSLALQALTQISDTTLLDLAHVVAICPESVWLDAKRRDEAMALTELLAVVFAELGVN